MNVFFRVDSSSLLGNGHLIRCINFANLLRLENNKLNINFIIIDYKNEKKKLILDKNFKIHLIKHNNNYQHNISKDLNKIKWHKNYQKQNFTDVKEILLKFSNSILIVDHYALKYNWQKNIYKYCKKLIIFDDFAENKSFCDILINQNFHYELINKYKKLVKKNTKIFIGPEYAFLEENFYSYNYKIRNKIKHVLIYLGSFNNEKLYNLIINSVEKLDYHAKYTLIIDKKINIKFKNKKNFKIITKNKPMHKILKNIDICIGACGISIWERFKFGIPSIVIVTSKNQLRDSINLHKIGAILNLGYFKSINSNKIIKSLEAIFFDVNKYKQMQSKSYTIMKKNKIKNKILSLVK
tara:strand:+ start:11872 stop:12930 length:1059 start_codon:yes stop_codon:yes gene_type:complete